MHSDRLIWPPPRPSIAALYATLMVPQHDPGFSAHWAAAQIEDSFRRAATEQWWAEEDRAPGREQARGEPAAMRLLSLAGYTIVDEDGGAPNSGHIAATH